MEKNTTTILFINFVNAMECPLDFLVLTHPCKMEKLKEKPTSLITSLVPFSPMPLYHHLLWHHALQMATYLHIILPNKKLSLKSPTKTLYQKDPPYSHLQVFGCVCYPLRSSTSRNKLQARSTPCVLGYPPNHRGYKCYDLLSCKIFISRHVIFEENMFPFSDLNAHITASYNFLDIGMTSFLQSYTYAAPT